MEESGNNENITSSKNQRSLPRFFHKGVVHRITGDKNTASTSHWDSDGSLPGPCLGPIRALLAVICVTLTNKSTSGPQLPYLQNGNKKITAFKGCL